MYYIIYLNNTKRYICHGIGGIKSATCSSIDLSSIIATFGFIFCLNKT